MFKAIDVPVIHFNSVISPHNLASPDSIRLIILASPASIRLSNLASANSIRLIILASHAVILASSLDSTVARSRGNSTSLLSMSASIRA